MKIPDYMSSYVKLLPIKTNEGNPIELIEVHAPFDNNELITEWARSFRLKYISDEDLLESMEDTGLQSGIEFLRSVVYPQNSKFRNGDFGEILVAEYLMYVEKFWVPTLTLRYSDKATSEESVKGSDIIAIHFELNSNQESPDDVLCICEVKTGSVSSVRGRLQDAVNDSNKDDLQLHAAKRGSIGLNAVKLKLKRKERAGNSDSYSYRAIARFQNPFEHPYQTQYEAAAVVDQKRFNRETIKKIEAKESQHVDSLRMIVVGVTDIKKLIDVLYSELGVANIGNEQ